MSRMKLLENIRRKMSRNETKKETNYFIVKTFLSHCASNQPPKHNHTLPLNFNDAFASKNENLLHQTKPKPKQTIWGWLSLRTTLKAQIKR